MPQGGVGKSKHEFVVWARSRKYARVGGGGTWGAEYIPASSRNREEFKKKKTKGR